MKKLKCLLFVAVVALAFAGCRKPVEVSFAENAKEIAAVGETFEVGLKSNGEWTVTTSVDWVSVAPSSGSGDATLTVMVQSNLTSESRTAEIKAVTKDHSDLLNLTQAMEGFITVAPTSIFCGDDGGEFNVEIVIEATDRMGLLKDITIAVSDAAANILSASTQTTRDGVARLRFLVCISDASLLDPLLASISRVPSVFDARRLMPGEGSGQMKRRA